MSLLEITTIWGGFTGAPGYTNLHFNSGVWDQSAVDAAFDANQALWNALSPVFASGMTHSPVNEAKEFTVATGALVQTWSPSTFKAPMSGSNVASIGPGPAGACVSLGTSHTTGNRHLRGRCFLVPLAAPMFDGDGTLTTGCLQDINGAWAALLGNEDVALAIWHRPVNDTGGEFGIVTSQTTKDKAAVLRSRRD